MHRHCRGMTAVLLMLLAAGAGAQEYASFEVLLQLNTASAEKTLELYEGLAGRPSDVAALPGSRIALSTTAALARRPLTLAQLERSLEAVKYNQDLGDDIFRMKEAREHAAQIKELLLLLRSRNFTQRVVSTVAQLFPADVRVSTRLPLFVVAFGHQNIDAYVQRVVWRGGEPVNVGEGQGEVTIVVNLAKAVSYGHSADERFLGLLTVVAHEVFHAVFSVYKTGSPAWRQYYQSYRRPFDQLLDLAQNEGVAYYLNLVQRSRGTLPQDWDVKVGGAFDTFNRAAEEMLLPSTSQARAYDLLLRSNTSGYWENYGAITGMIVARQIDRTLGRAALAQTLNSGPHAFFSIYADLMRQDDSIPRLSFRVLEEVSRVR